MLVSSSVHPGSPRPWRQKPFALRDRWTEPLAHGTITRGKMSSRDASSGHEYVWDPVGGKLAGFCGWIVTHSERIRSLSL